jgi:phage-related protein
MVDSEDIPEVPLRPLVWMGDSRKNIRAFPEEVQKAVGYALQLVEAGETPRDAKLFKGWEAACMRLSNGMIPIPTGRFMR